MKIIHYPSLRTLTLGIGILISLPVVAESIQLPKNDLDSSSTLAASEVSFMPPPPPESAPSEIGVAWDWDGKPYQDPTADSGLPYENHEFNPGNSTISITYGNGLFIAGAGGAMADIIISPDGYVWTHQSVGNYYYIKEIKWTGKLFVALTYQGEPSGPAYILTSPDGINWTQRYYEPANYFNAICWNDTQIVVIGTEGIIVTSSDGITWSKQVSGTTTRLSKIRWLGNQFIIDGSDLEVIYGDPPPNPKQSVVTSPDGISWTCTLFDAILYESYSTLWNGTQFVRVGPNGAIFTSLDNIIWTNRSLDTTDTLLGLMWDGSQFITIAYGTTQATILTSPDGAIWTAQFSDNGHSSPPFGRIAWNGTIYVTAGGDSIDGTWSGHKGRIFTSSDAITWTELAVDVPDFFINLYWDEFQFIAIGFESIWTSKDGIKWTCRFAPNSGFALFNVVSTQTTSVVISSGGSVYTYDHNIRKQLSWNENTTSDLGNGWLTTEIGTVFSGYFPCVYIWELESWVYLYGQTDYGYYLYLYSQDRWLWTNSEDYPNGVVLKAGDSLDKKWVNIQKLKPDTTTHPLPYRLMEQIVSESGSNCWEFEIEGDGNPHFTNAVEDQLYLVWQSCTGRAQNVIYGECIVEQYPWIYNRDIGAHAFFRAGEPDSIPAAFIWTPANEWLYTAQDWYPFLWSFQHENWIWIDAGEGHSHRWFLYLGDEEWEYLPTP